MLQARALREERFQEKKVLFPFSLLLPLLGAFSAESCVNVVVRVFPLTSTPSMAAGCVCS